MTRMAGNSALAVRARLPEEEDPMAEDDDDPRPDESGACQCARCDGARRDALGLLRAACRDDDCDDDAVTQCAVLIASVGDLPLTAEVLARWAVMIIRDRCEVQGSRKSASDVIEEFAFLEGLA